MAKKVRLTEKQIRNVVRSIIAEQGDEYLEAEGGEGIPYDKKMEYQDLKDRMEDIRFDLASTGLGDEVEGTGDLIDELDNIIMQIEELID